MPRYESLEGDIVLHDLASPEFDKVIAKAAVLEQRLSRLGGDSMASLLQTVTSVEQSFARTAEHIEAVGRTLSALGNVRTTTADTLKAIADAAGNIDVARIERAVQVTQQLIDVQRAASASSSPTPAPAILPAAVTSTPFATTSDVTLRSEAARVTTDEAAAIEKKAGALGELNAQLAATSRVAGTASAALNQLDSTAGNIDRAVQAGQKLIEVQAEIAASSAALSQQAAAAVVPGILRDSDPGEMVQQARAIDEKAAALARLNTQMAVTQRQAVDSSSAVRQLDVSVSNIDAAVRSTERLVEIQRSASFSTPLSIEGVAPTIVDTSSTVEAQSAVTKEVAAGAEATKESVAAMERANTRMADMERQATTAATAIRDLNNATLEVATNMNSTGFGGIGGAGGSMVENMYDRLWGEVSGATTAIDKSLSAQVAHRAYQGGMIKSPDEMRVLLREAQSVIEQANLAGAPPEQAVTQWWNKLSTEGLDLSKLRQAVDTTDQMAESLGNVASAAGEAATGLAEMNQKGGGAIDALGERMTILDDIFRQWQDSRSGGPGAEAVDLFGGLDSAVTRMLPASKEDVKAMMKKLTHEEMMVTPAPTVAPYRRILGGDDQMPARQLSLFDEQNPSSGFVDYQAIYDRYFKYFSEEGMKYAQEGVAQGQLTPEAIDDVEGNAVRAAEFLSEAIGRLVDALEGTLSEEDIARNGEPLTADKAMEEALGIVRSDSRRIRTSNGDAVTSRFESNETAYWQEGMPGFADIMNYLGEHGGKLGQHLLRQAAEKYAKALAEGVPADSNAMAQILLSDYRIGKKRDMRLDSAMRYMEGIGVGLPEGNFPIASVGLENSLRSADELASTMDMVNDKFLDTYRNTERWGEGDIGVRGIMGMLSGTDDRRGQYLYGDIQQRIAKNYSQGYTGQELAGMVFDEKTMRSLSGYLAGQGFKGKVPLLDMAKSVSSKDFDSMVTGMFAPRAGQMSDEEAYYAQQQQGAGYSGTGMRRSMMAQRALLNVSNMLLPGVVPRPIMQGMSAVNSIGYAVPELGSAVQSIMPALTTLGITAAGITGAVAAIKGASDALADFDRRQQALDKLDSKFGNARDAARQLQDAIHDIAPEKDILNIMGMVPKGSELTDVEKLADVAEIAKGAAFDLGTSWQQAMATIVNAVQGGDAASLERMGLIDNANGALLDYAASIGKLVPQLTEWERQEALLAAALEKQKAAAAEPASEAEQMQDAYAQLSAVTGDAVTAFGNWVASLLDSGAQSAANVWINLLNNIAAGIDSIGSGFNREANKRFVLGNPGISDEDKATFTSIDSQYDTTNRQIGRMFNRGGEFANYFVDYQLNPEGTIEKLRGTNDELDQLVSARDAIADDLQAATDRLMQGLSLEGFDMDSTKIAEAINEVARLQQLIQDNNRDIEILSGDGPGSWLAQKAVRVEHNLEPNAVGNEIDQKMRDNDTYRAQIAALQQQIAPTVQMNSSPEVRVQQNLASIDELDKRIAEGEARLKELEAHAANPATIEAQQQLIEAQEARVRLVDTMARTQAEGATQFAAGQEAQEKLNAARAEKDRLQAEIDKIEQQMADTDRAAVTAEAKMADLQAQKDSALAAGDTTTADEIQRKIENVVQVNEAIADGKSMLSSTLYDLARSMSTQLNVVDSLEKTRDDAIAKTNAQTEAYAEQKRQLDETNAKIAEYERIVGQGDASVTQQKLTNAQGTQAILTDTMAREKVAGESDFDAGRMANERLQQAKASLEQMKADAARIQSEIKDAVGLKETYNRSADLLQTRQSAAYASGDRVAGQSFQPDIERALAAAESLQGKIDTSSAGLIELNRGIAAQEASIGSLTSKRDEALANANAHTEAYADQKRQLDETNAAISEYEATLEKISKATPEAIEYAKQQLDAWRAQREELEQTNASLGANVDYAVKATGGAAALDNLKSLAANAPQGIGTQIDVLDGASVGSVIQDFQRASQAKVQSAAATEMVRSTGTTDEVAAAEQTQALVEARYEAAAAAVELASATLQMQEATSAGNDADVAAANAALQTAIARNEEAQAGYASVQTTIDSIAAKERLAEAEQNLQNAMKTGEQSLINAAQGQYALALAQAQAAEAKERDVESSANVVNIAGQVYEKVSMMPLAYDRATLSSAQLGIASQNLAIQLQNLEMSALSAGMSIATRLIPYLGISGSFESYGEYAQGVDTMRKDFQDRNAERKANGESELSGELLGIGLQMMQNAYSEDTSQLIMKADQSKQAASGMGDAWERALKQMEDALESFASNVLQDTTKGLIPLDEMLPRQDEVDEAARRMADVAKLGTQSPNFEAVKGYFSEEELAKGEDFVKTRAAEMVREHQKGLRTDFYDTDMAAGKVLEQIKGKQNQKELVAEVREKVKDQAGAEGLTDADIMEMLGIDSTPEQIGGAVSSALKDAFPSMEDTAQMFHDAIYGVTPKEGEEGEEGATTKPLIESFTVTEEDTTTLAGEGKKAAEAVGESFSQTMTDNQYAERGVTAITQAVESNKAKLQQSGKDAASWWGEALLTKMKTDIPPGMLDLLVDKLLPLLTAALAAEGERNGGAAEE